MSAISVVMPTYNTSVPILTEAVYSILEQTFKEFEFIIIDDGSTDEAKDFLGRLNDSRIKVIHNEKNIGITKSLNKGFRAAQGKYIARMDSDDISMPNRLEKQYEFMENNPDVIICGARVTKDPHYSYTPHSNATASYGRSKRWAMESMETYRIRMLFSNPGPHHPTAFFRRRELIINHIEYDENLKYAQDYGMWVACSKYGRIITMQDTLLFYRSHDKQISKAHREEQIKCEKMTQRKLLCQLVDDVTEEELDIHYSTGYHHANPGYKSHIIKTTKAVKNWYTKLILANNNRKIYDKNEFNAYIYEILYQNVKQPFDDDMSVIKMQENRSL